MFACKDQDSQHSARPEWNFLQVPVQWNDDLLQPALQLFWASPCTSRFLSHPSRPQALGHAHSSWTLSADGEKSKSTNQEQEWHLVWEASFHQPSAGTRPERAESSSPGSLSLQTRQAERIPGRRWGKWGSTARWGWRYKTGTLASSWCKKLRRGRVPCSTRTSWRA